MGVHFILNMHILALSDSQTVLFNVLLPCFGTRVVISLRFVHNCFKVNEKHICLRNIEKCIIFMCAYHAKTGKH